MGPPSLFCMKNRQYGSPQHEAADTISLISFFVPMLIIEKVRGILLDLIIFKKKVEWSYISDNS